MYDLTAGQDGCIRYDYYSSDREPDVILLVEQWESREHQQAHLNQPKLNDIASAEGLIFETVVHFLSLCYNGYNHGIMEETIHEI